MLALSYPLRALRLLWSLALFFLVLGVQHACGRLPGDKSPAVCVDEAAPLPRFVLFYVPGPAADWPVATSGDTSALDRKRLPRSQWRGFAGPAYHVGAWPRPARVPRDSAGHVIHQRPAL
jgi:hypothetical protein